MKRNSLWSLALAAVWIAAAAVGCLVPASFASAATVASGSCGASGFSLTWTLDDQGTLTISGQGTMRDYGYGEAPEAWTGIPASAGEFASGYVAWRLDGGRLSRSRVWSFRLLCRKPMSSILRMS